VALINCKECNNQVSDSAKACPHCGKKLKTSLFFKAFIALIVGFFIYNIFNAIDSFNKYKANINSDKNTPITAASTPTPTVNEGYQLNERQILILNFLLDLEIKDTVAGNDTLLGRIMFKKDVTAQEIATAYEENEVKGDQQFINKTIRVIGTIHSIESGLGNAPYITFNVQNEWRPPHAKFKEGLIEQIASLKKGQKVNLVCNGSGEVAGHAMLDQCEFFDSYIQHNIPNLLSLSKDYLKGKQPENELIKMLTEMFLSAAMFAEIAVPQLYECLNTEKTTESQRLCAESLQNIQQASEPEKERIKNDMKNLISQLESHHLTELSKFMNENLLKLSEK